MTSPPDNKTGLLKIAAAIIFVAIICVLIAVVVTSPFSTSPQKNITSPDIIPIPSGVSAITPSAGAYGTLVPVTILGTNFTYGPSPSIWLTKAGERDVYAADVAVISPTRITCTFPLPASSTSAGPWEVFLQNVNEQSGSKIGVFTVTNEISPPFEWNWTTANGWDGWQSTTTCTEAGTGPCTEYGPVMENGYGVYGSRLSPDSGSSTESRVWKTFTAPAGTRWNTLTFNGLLSSSTVDYTRSMTIYVNNEMVFSGDASQSPPGNGQQFTITKSFTPANRVDIRISGKQDPIFETDQMLYTLQFNSLTLS